MNSFNVYGQTEKKIGGNVPVWLGTVKPIPVGGKVDGVEPGTIYPAGSPVEFDANSRFVAVLDADQLADANGYLYNDVFIEENLADSEITATCAVVMHHAEGLLIERALPEITEEQIAQLQAKIPGVLLVRG